MASDAGLSAREEELLRVIGAERDAHAPDILASVEAELARRAGGTRHQARRRLKRTTAFHLAVGLTLLAAIGVTIAILSRDEPERGGVLGNVALLIPLGLLLALALLFLAWGVGLFARPASMQRLARFIPSSRPSDFAAAFAEPSLESLLASVGNQRSRRSSDEVAVAEAELRRRLAEGGCRRTRELRRWGMLAAVVGGYLGIIGTLHLVVFTIALMRGKVQVGPAGESRLLCAMTIAACALNAAFGWGLLIGGIGMRRLRLWSFGLIPLAIWSYLGAGLALVPLMLLWMALVGTPAKDLVLQLALLPFALALNVAVCWKLTRPFTRLEYSELCR